MVTFENEVIIKRPVEDVFGFVGNLENLPKWNYYVQNVTRTSTGTSSRGAEYHQIRKEDEQDLRVLEHIPNQLLIIETIPPSKPKLHREMVFEEDAGTTRIIDTWELDLGIPGVLEKIAVSRVRSAVHENLDKLKSLLESGHATLQDGRSVRISD